MVPNNTVFIRTKQIKQHTYAYLVENTWSKGRAKQRVKKYLGRVYKLKEPAKPKIAGDAKELLKKHIDYETQHKDEDIRIDLKHGRVTKNGREVVLALNGGHFCSHTLQTLLKARYVRNEEQPGLALATAFAEAGIRISQEAFIKIYKEYAT